jgi:hypothetical protein
MFRVWIAGAAFFSFVFPSFGAETFDSSLPVSSSTPAITGAPISTPTNNAASRFSGATGLEAVLPTSPVWSSPALMAGVRSSPWPMSANLLPSAASVAASNDSLQWTDARRAVSSYLGPSGSVENYVSLAKQYHRWHS